MSIQVYTINLERRPDRKCVMERQFSKLEIENTFVSAIDCKSANFQEVVRAYSLKSNGPWGGVTDSTKACTLSHAKLLEKFLSTDKQFCVVLEDDAVLSSDLPKWLSDLSWIPEGSDIIRLEHWNRSGHRLVISSHYHAHLNRRIHHLYSRTAGAAGLIIKRRSAKNILDHIHGAALPIDHILLNIGASRFAAELNICQVVPGLIVQEDKKSNKSDIKIETRRTLPPLRYARRELKRGVLELKPIPGLLPKFFTGSVRLIKNEFEDSAL